MNYITWMSNQRIS